jgi:redox-sensitive bicupin YhaK (pirin superfamily)
MIKIRKSSERGGASHGWLDSKHTFSFSDYYDVNHMGFKSLRVINEDLIAPDSGFGAHPHKDMEIISYVVSGALTHKDNMGNESTLNAGEFQAMTAGSGVVHSEFNKSKTEKVHLLQIWILPEVKGLPPTYQEMRPALGKGLTLITSEEGRNGSMKINQNADLFFGDFAQGSKFTHELKPGRGAWLQLVSGELEFVAGASEYKLSRGDGASFEGEFPEVKVSSDAQFLLFDLV